jgi:UDP-N-acetylglucosamine--N-acetylmuramyl-(pentapeptide) pyrophosphoryl-undecaprenol N-acetylglucosamine transferase
MTEAASRRGHRGIWAVIAGGGTGGHIIPAIAIGRAMVDAGHPAGSILFVGSRRGLEDRLIPAAGFEVVRLPGRGITRRLSLANVAAVFGLGAAFVEAVLLVRRARPAVVVAVGGYASLATGLAAALWRVPLVVAEQNAGPGRANRVAGRFAAACAVSFPGTPLPRAVLTGNPVRPEILAVDRTPAGRAAARRALGLPEGRLVVAVAGGSLGARRINEAVLHLAGEWSARSDLVIRHVIGTRDFAEFSRRPPAGPAGGLVYQQIRFEDRMDLLLAAADIGVFRAGAGTVAEVAVAGLPALLVPLPGAPGDHQTINARRLADAGAAALVPDAQCDATRLAAELEPLLGDGAARAAMGAAARTMAYPGAAADVAALAEKHARG